MAEEKKLTREELYRRIREGSREEVILEEMIRLGFWPADEEMPREVEAAIKRRGELQREANELRSKLGRLGDAERALAEERKRRREESKRRRAENAKRRAEERARRRAAWEEKKAAGTFFLGEGVSGGLSTESDGDDAAVGRQQLPPLRSGRDIAAKIGITIGKLRWLTYHREGATLCHYVRFTIPKKSGGDRLISAPLPLLRKAQSWIKEQILDRLTPADEAQGFVRARSILTNATPHAGQQIVVNVDLKDFFPTFGFRRVKGLFRKLGYNEAVATILALLCTEPPRAPVTVDGEKVHIALGERVLPQGSCCSPALTNLMCRRLDRRLAGLANKHGLRYTRYADDITLSGARTVEVAHVLGALRRIVEDEGLRVHPKKTRVLRPGRRQEVTGLVVNGPAPTISRRERRRIRAILHNCKKKGFASQNREGRRDFVAHLRGLVSFVQMVQPDHGRALRERLERIVREDGGSR